MGGSFSTLDGQKEGPSDHHAAHGPSPVQLASTPCQITVSLLGKSGPDQAVAPTTQSLLNSSSAASKGNIAAMNAHQAVLFWDCDTANGQDQTTKATHGSSSSLIKHQLLMPAAAAAGRADDAASDMHPVSGTDDAPGTSSSTSRTSSAASLHGRSSTADDIPWQGSSMPDLIGPDELSDAEDACLHYNPLLAAATARNDAAAAAVPLPVTTPLQLARLGPSALQAGRLVIHPKANNAPAEQVVWVLSKQQLLRALQPSQATTTATATTTTSRGGGGITGVSATGAVPALHLVSPSFVLPCTLSSSSSSSSSCAGAGAGGIPQHASTEWCLLLQTSSTAANPTPLPHATNTNRTWQLSLHMRWAPSQLPQAGTSLSGLSGQHQAASSGHQAAPSGPSGLSGPTATKHPTAAAAAASPAAASPAAARPESQASGTGSAVFCRGAVAAGFGRAAGAAGGTGSSAGQHAKGTGSGFKLVVQQNEESSALPLTICITNSSTTSAASTTSSIPADAPGSSTSSASSPARAKFPAQHVSQVVRGLGSCLSKGPTEQQQQRQQQQGLTGDSARTSSSSGSSSSTSVEPGMPSSSSDVDDELHVIVSFSDVHLLLQGTATGSSSSSSTPKQHQQAIPSTKPHHHSSLQTSSSSSRKTATDTNLAPSASSSSTGDGLCMCDSSSSSGGVVSSIPPGLQAVRQVSAVLLSVAPRLLVIDGFFDAAMCRGLMELAGGKLVRSRVASGSETPSRTSWSHFFVKEACRQALVAAAESQIEALFACPAVRGPHRPLAKVEALQVVKYHEGEFYHEHYDNRADSPRTRAATIIVYLCDTEAGGATSFPRAVTGLALPQASLTARPQASLTARPQASLTARPAGGAAGAGDWQLQLPPKVTVGPGGRGIKVFPVQGRALVFWSKRPNDDEEPNSIHAADAVVKGEKWIATRWMKDN